MWKWLERVNTVLGIPSALLALIPIVLAILAQLNETSREWVNSRLNFVFQILTTPVAVSLPVVIIVPLVLIILILIARYVLGTLPLKPKTYTTHHKNLRLTYYLDHKNKLPQVTKVVCGYCSGLITEIGSGIPNIMGVVRCENGHDLGSNNGYAFFQDYSDFVVRSFQNEYMNRLNATQTEAIKNDVWGKSGNLWWLCRDMAIVISLTMDVNSTKLEIDHYLLKCHHHAVKVMGSEQIVARLQHLKDQARNYSQSDWTSQKRREYQQALNSIYNDIGKLSEQNQRDFDPGPSLL